MSAKETTKHECPERYKGKSILNEIIDQLTAKVAVARELQIIAALKRHGFEFVDSNDLHSFVKDRCVVVDDHGKNALFVDETIYICEWNATPSVEYFGDKITVTI